MKRLQRSSARRSLKKVAEVGETPPQKRKTNNIWSEVPEMEEGETREMLEEKISQLKRICKSNRPDHATLKNLMAATYPLRRKEVLESSESLDGLVKRYPPLLKPIYVSN
jgi:hypothetical protein